MSIYSALSIDVPVIVYSVLHQMKKGIGEKEYRKAIRDMHDMVHEETTKVTEVWKSHLADVTASSVQTTRGTLSQFLTLPLDTDKKEIYTILQDQIGQLLKQTLPISKIGVTSSTEGKVLWEREQNSVLQALQLRGKDYLKKFKFKLADEDLHIFESDYFLEGGLNLDIIEHIVRDRMGIYAIVHGQHITQTEPFVFAAHNLVYLKGPLDSVDVKYEAVIHFAKGKPPYAPFRKGLVELLDNAQNEIRLSHCSIWQRKLGLGSGTEFNLRMRAGDRKTLKDFILVLVKFTEKNPVYGPIIKNGHLVVKEITL
jgi:hypothetical protein